MPRRVEGPAALFEMVDPSVPGSVLRNHFWFPKGFTDQASNIMETKVRHNRDTRQRLHALFYG